MLKCSVESSKFFPGSFMFVSQTLRPEHPPICEEIEQLCSSVNVCCCLVKSKFHRIAIVSVYRSPSVPFTVLISELQSVLMLLSTSVNYIMVAGDFNVNLLVFGGASKEYLNLLSDYQLAQHIRKPTRICALSETLTDHVFGTKYLDVMNKTNTSPGCMKNITGE